MGQAGVASWNSFSEKLMLAKGKLTQLLVICSFNTMDQLGHTEMKPKALINPLWAVLPIQILSACLFSGNHLREHAIKNQAKMNADKYVIRGRQSPQIKD